jgi:hypothetical protein
MKVLDKPTPKWFKSVSSNLSKIEANKAAYEDLDEGTRAPGEKVFAAAREFVEILGQESDVNLEEPRITVSVNGQLGLAFGGKKRSLDVLFTPKTHFYFKDADIGEDSGEGTSKAIELATTYFRL